MIIVKCNYWRTTQRGVNEKDWTVHVLIYTKRKSSETFINTYKNPDTFQKSRQFSLRFYSKKSPTLYVTQVFMNCLKLAFIYIQKEWHFAFRDIFIYKKPDTSKKARQFALCFFIYKNTYFDKTFLCKKKQEKINLFHVSSIFLKPKYQYFSWKIKME